MFYNYFFTSEHINVYPSYMNHSERLNLKQKLERENLKLFCGCSLFSEKQLEYGVATDGKIYPLHQGYEHSPLCARANSSKRMSSYITKEDGTATAYLDFKCKEFTVPVIKEEDTEVPADESAAEDTMPADNEKPADDEEPAEKPAKAKKEEKEPFDSLAQFTLQLNTDTYRERVMAGKGLLPADYFLNSLMARLKKVYVHGIEKPIREITLEDDATQFFYLPIIDVEYDTSARLVLKGWKSDYKWFLHDATLIYAMNVFKKQYGIDFLEALKNKNLRIMAAGFRYMRLSRKSSLYKVVGRLHLFIVNENGLYCRDMDELDELNAISNYMQSNHRYKYIQFERVIDDKRIFGIFSRKGKKQIVVCKPTVPKSIALQGKNHLAFATGTEKITEETLEILDQLMQE